MTMVIIIVTRRRRGSNHVLLHGGRRHHHLPNPNKVHPVTTPIPLHPKQIIMKKKKNPTM
jgi:hypothetical protein